MAQLLDRDTEKPILEALYITEAAATDQLKRDPEALRRITNGFNRITSRDYDADVLLRYMINRRKNTDWPCLGERAKKFDPLRDVLSSNELEVLKNIYVGLDITSDTFLYEPSLMSQVASRFQGVAARFVAGSILVGVIMACRKRGMWPKLRTAFGDMNQIVGM